MQSVINNSPEKLMEVADLELSLTISKCLALPTIYEMSQQSSRRNVLIVIRTLILMSAKSFKFAEKMDEETATLLTTDLYSYFKFESLEDVVLMLKMARTGQLGSGKGRLDSDTLFNIFIPNYLLFKADEREKIYLRQKNSNKSEVISPEAYEKFEQLSKMVDKAKEKRDAENPVPSPINHHQIYLQRLRASLPNMNDKELKDTMLNLRASGSDVFKDAILVTNEEIAKRKQNAGKNQTKKQD